MEREIDLKNAIFIVELGVYDSLFQPILMVDCLCMGRENRLLNSLVPEGNFKQLIGHQKTVLGTVGILQIVQIGV